MGNFKPGEIGFRMKPEDYGITKYKFNSDGTLDVFESVNLSYKNLKELPFKFGKVDGYFDCWENNLTSLKGSPKIVKGNFYCDNNNLTSFKYTPEEVNGDFYCNGVNLKSIEGLNLNGISGTIYVYHNPNLKLSEKEQLWVNLNPGKLVLK